VRWRPRRQKRVHFNNSEGEINKNCSKNLNEKIERTQTIPTVSLLVLWYIILWVAGLLFTLFMTSIKDQFYHHSFCYLLERINKQSDVFHCLERCCMRSSDAFFQTA